MHPRLRTLVPSVLAMASAAGLLAGPAAGQLEYGGVPAAPVPGGERARLVPTLELEPPDVAALLLEDLQRGDSGAWHYGEVLPVGAGIEDAGAWERLPDGARIWRLRVRSAGALSLGLVFGRFALPHGAELFLYDDERTAVHGAYLDLNNRLDGTFAVQPIPGEAVTLEYYVPAGTPSGELLLESVVHDYRGVLDRLGGTARSGTCEVDVACPQGQPWQDQAAATIQIVANGLACSGVLLNSTAGDSRPLVLSARHCGNLSSGVFVFQYENSTCGGNDATQSHAVSGSTELARDRDTDFRLVELDGRIPVAYQPFYAGWSRSSTPAASSVCIHHPDADPKKISTDLDPPVKSTFFWQVVDWDDGSTEPGSSGAPLFDDAGRVRGQLSGGLAACGNDESDYFGALDLYWDLVAPFLDPLGTGAVAIDGLDPDLVGPARITAVVPSTIDVLIPGTAETITIQGGTFSSSSVVQVDGTPIGTTWSLVAADTITFDMPTVALGPHTVEVANPQGTAVFPVQVVPPDTPRLELAGGDDPAPIFEFLGAPVVFGGEPGAVHCLLGSFSPVPSSLPGRIDLDLGNQFMDLYHCGQFVIETDGTTEVLMSVKGLKLLGLSLYLQSFDVRLPFPLEVSNLQHGVVQ